MGGDWIDRLMEVALAFSVLATLAGLVGMVLLTEVPCG